MFQTNGSDIGIGQQALPNLSAGGRANIAVGAGALSLSTTGSFNVALGTDSLEVNLDGVGNTAVGAGALFANQHGSHNVSTGHFSLFNATGSLNTALGQYSGFDLGNGDNNVYLANQGQSAESNTIRIGQQAATTFIPAHTATYVAGVSGAISPGGVGVFVNGDGKLGTILSSQRYKHNVRSLGPESGKVLQLRPVAFEYTAALDPGQLPQYGLIAEEVATVAPELIVQGADGSPETVRYHLLVPMLLNEIQRLSRQADESAKELTELRTRLNELEQARR